MIYRRQGFLAGVRFGSSPSPFPPSLPSASCLSFSVFLCLAGRAYCRERRVKWPGEEPNHTTARSLVSFKSFNTLCLQRSETLYRSELLFRVLSGLKPSSGHCPYRWLLLCSCESSEEETGGSPPPAGEDQVVPTTGGAPLTPSPPPDAAAPLAHPEPPAPHIFTNIKDSGSLKSANICLRFLTWLEIFYVKIWLLNCFRLARAGPEDQR